jgi:hypothetical protein
MKSVGVFAATYLADKQLETHDPQMDAGLEHDRTLAADQRVIESPRRRRSPRRWLRAVRGTAAA